MKDSLPAFDLDYKQLAKDSPNWSPADLKRWANLAKKEALRSGQTQVQRIILIIQKLC